MSAVSVACASASETPTTTAFATAAPTDAEAASSSHMGATRTEPTTSSHHPIPQPVKALAETVAANEASTMPTAMSSSAPCTTAFSSSPLVASAGGSGASTPSRKPPKKGHCNQCNARVALVKQTTNRCRCDYVFCDTHRFPDQHDCKFDFKESDRMGLMKNNPKLNTRPKGGRSFTRID
ncbi:hypothetical protein GGI22_000448 [Coemansia erecta]|nr:hypothetical protein GGI22_000448 [Coemansia erecta]